MTTVFIARLQPLHIGHKKVIDASLEEYSDFKVVIGSANKERTQENPLSFEEREEILKSCFPDLEVEPVEDESMDEEGNEKWASKIMEQFEPDRIISRNDLVQRLFEDRDVEVIEQKVHDRDVYSGTEVRRRIRSGEEWRYLIPDCSRDKLEKHIEAIKETGIDYEFKPGWKKKNSFYNTVEDK